MIGPISFPFSMQSGCFDIEQGGNLLIRHGAAGLNDSPFPSHFPPQPENILPCRKQLRFPQDHAAQHGNLERSKPHGMFQERSPRVVFQQGQVPVPVRQTPDINRLPGPGSWGKSAQVKSGCRRFIYECPTP